jgi:flagellum-specific peptidoglycan hydrolase FlgJ
MSSPMAVRVVDRAGPSRASQLAAAGALVLAISSLWGQESVISATRDALDGLRDQQVYALDLDAGDRPAMDPGLARIVDPRSKLSWMDARPSRLVPVQPFEYEVRDGETLHEIAARFGTDVDALLWNNGLDRPDQIAAGARLAILPVRGVLHLVRDSETLASIAERYGSRIEDVMAANAIERSDQVVPGQVIVVAGGSVPMLPVDRPPVDGVERATAQAATAVLAAASPNPSPEPREEDLPPPAGAADWQRDFIFMVAPGARESQRQTGVPASVTLAQAILESDWGRSRLSREANNLFGIKALRSPGSAGVYEINTWEVYAGRNVTVLGAFKAYLSLADSIADHGRWFHDNSRYHPALEVRDDPRAFAHAISAAGYATDPAYAPKLIGLMDRFDLYAYDVKAGE